MKNMNTDDPISRIPFFPNQNKLGTSYLFRLTFQEPGYFLPLGPGFSLSLVSGNKGYCICSQGAPLAFTVCFSLTVNQSQNFMPFFRVS